MTMRAVLITGAAGGIGSVTAELLARRGFYVFAGVRHAAPATLREARIVPMDVTSPDSVAAAEKTIAAELNSRAGGRLVGLVNAATAEYHGPLEILPMRFVQHEIEVNYVGALSVTRTFLPLLRAGAGRIVNISSINGRCVFPSIGASCASKYALEAASDALRLELHRWRIPVVIIEPGAVATPLWDRTLKAFEELPTHVPAQDLELYYPSWAETLTRARDDKERLLRWASAPEKVGRVIARALTRRRPKGRYLVGWDAHAIAMARRLLPDRAFDALARRTFRE